MIITFHTQKSYNCRFPNDKMTTLASSDPTYVIGKMLSMQNKDSKKGWRKNDVQKLYEELQSNKFDLNINDIFPNTMVTENEDEYMKQLNYIFAHTFAWFFDKQMHPQIVITDHTVNDIINLWICYHASISPEEDEKIKLLKQCYDIIPNRCLIAKDGSGDILSMDDIKKKVDDNPEMVKDFEQFISSSNDPDFSSAGMYFSDGIKLGCIICTKRNKYVIKCISISVYRCWLLKYIIGGCIVDQDAIDAIIDDKYGIFYQGLSQEMIFSILSKEISQAFYKMPKPSSLPQETKMFMIVLNTKHVA